MSRVLAAGLVVLAAASASSGGAAAARWVITDLGPGAAVDVNEAGQVVGGGAFVWQNGKKTQLGTLGGRRSSVVAINDRGQVIGGSETAQPVRGHAFIRQKGKMIDLGTLGGRRSGARAINNRGQVVGDSTTMNGTSHAFLWQNGRMRDLGTLGGGYAAGSGAVDVNEAGQVVGSSYSSTISYGQCGVGVHGFLWQRGRMHDLGTLGGKLPTSAAVAINDRGWIVGNSPATCGGSPFLWRNGNMIKLRAFPGGEYGGEAIAINERGEVIGNTGISGVQHAFVWQERQDDRPRPPQPQELVELSGRDQRARADRRQLDDGKRQGSRRPLDAEARHVERSTAGRALFPARVFGDVA